MCVCVTQYSRYNIVILGVVYIYVCEFVTYMYMSMYILLMLCI